MQQNCPPTATSCSVVGSEVPSAYGTHECAGALRVPASLVDQGADMSVSRTRDVRMRIGPALLASYTTTYYALHYLLPAL